MSKSTNNDIVVIFRYLFPMLKPYIWSIVGSLSITGIVIGTDLLQPTCFKWLLDAATQSAHYRHVLLMLILLLVLAVVRSIVSYWEGYARSKVGEGISAEYKRRLFEHMLHLPLATLHEMESGILENRVLYDCAMIGRVYVTGQLLPLIAYVVQLLALIGCILALSWQVGLASILVMPCGWLVSRRMMQHNHAQMVQMRSIVERGQGFLQEVSACIREIRGAANEAGEIRRWNTWTHDYMQIACAITTERQFVRATLNKLIDWIGLCIVFGWGGWQLLHHHTTLGSLLALSLYVQQLYTTLANMLAIGAESGEIINALQAIHEVLNLPREWPDQGQALADVAGRLEFDDVSFSYNDRAATLQHISFKSMPGKVLGIVGPTGSGKSTLMNLCMRFYPLTAGKILLDGQDIAQIAPHALRQQIGVVSQDIQLWNTTIRENLLYALQPDVPWEHVLEICAKTRVHDFVQHLPQKYETIVGSRGVKLSGGEKQRIALARVLLRDPKILLLDEATSALDSLTEAAITQTLIEMFATKNRILVAHRLATVKSADQIIVIKDGQIVEEGSPKALYQQNGLYAALSQTQQISHEELSASAER
jgi:ABC-type multidrug transport system fused ATPase/permease subunit